MKLLRSTPAVALGITDHGWSIGELIDAALATQASNGNAGTDGEQGLKMRPIEPSIRSRAISEMCAHLSVTQVLADDWTFRKLDSAVVPLRTLLQGDLIDVFGA